MNGQSSRRMVGIAIAAVVATGLAACSSSGSSGGPTGGTTGGGGTTGAAPTSGSGSGSAALSGSTIKLGMISDVGTAVNFFDAVASARAAVRGVNARGGIDGHPVSLDFCNENFDPNKAMACGRQMVSDKVMATVGDQVITAEAAVDSLLKSAGIPNIGPISYGPSGQDPNSYLLSPGQEFINAAQSVAGVKFGGKRVSEFREDIPFTQPFKEFYQKSIPLGGGTYAGEVVVPPTIPTDYSTYAASMISLKPDVVSTNAAAAEDIGLLKAMDQLGYKGKMVVTADALALSDSQSLGSATSQLIYVSPFPPVSAAAKYPGLAQFKTDMAAEVASGDKDASNYQTYVRTYTLDSYFSVIAAAKIANAAKASDSTAMSTAMKAAKNVDLGGVIPGSWNPNTSVSSAIPRASVGSFFVTTLSGSTLNLAQPAPIDVTTVVDKSFAK